MCKEKAADSCDHCVYGSTPCETMIMEFAGKIGFNVKAIAKPEGTEYLFTKREV